MLLTITYRISHSPLVILSQCIFAITIYFYLPAFAKSVTPCDQQFTQIFNEWTDAFNRKDLEKSCQLFSKKLVANYQGVPQKNYDVICNGFREIFKNTHKQYQYHFKIHHTYCTENLAAVRITWYLKIFEDAKLLSTTQDEGMDILKLDENNQWKIVNFIGYPVHP